MAEDRVGAVFAALADPTRRHLVARLARTAATTTGLAADLPMSRQAVSKHLAALQTAGLVRGARAGREVVYELTAEGMAEAAAWMAEVGSEWDERLTRLAHLLSAGRTGEGPA